MPPWRIYYGDGSTFSSEDGRWEDAPDDDVQAVMIYRRPTRRSDKPKEIVMGLDEYDPLGTGHIKYGKWLLGPFDALVEEALDSEAP